VWTRPEACRIDDARLSLLVWFTEISEKLWRSFKFSSFLPTRIGTHRHIGRRPHVWRIGILGMGWTVDPRPSSPELCLA
jgi:hypothetical protein